MQEAGTSRAGARAHTAYVDRNVAQTRTVGETTRTPNPAGCTTRTSNLIALKDGVSVPEGYALVVDTRAEPAPLLRVQLRSAGETVDLSTPPKATVTATEKGSANAKSIAATKRNLTRNTNRKANASFAKELKESLATGDPITIKDADEQGNLKAVWHAAAKEVAYKFLDLTKETWKDYSIFEKTMVHDEINAQFKFDPPITQKRIDNYLSSHLRTSRAVWKAHWKKNGPSERHHNCPQAAWDRLCKWWPTAACKEEAAIMAGRRAKVEKNSKVGRSALVDRMDEQVCNYPAMPLYVRRIYLSLSVCNACIWLQAWGVADCKRTTQTCVAGTAGKMRACSLNPDTAYVHVLHFRSRSCSAVILATCGH